MLPTNLFKSVKSGEASVATWTLNVAAPGLDTAGDVGGASVVSSAACAARVCAGLLALATAREVVPRAETGALVFAVGVESGVARALLAGIHSIPCAAECIAHSTTSSAAGSPTLSMRTPNFRPDADGNSRPRLNREWLPGRRRALFSAVVPSSKRSVMIASPGCADVLVSVTSVSVCAPPPLSPSAMPHRVAGAMAPALWCTSCPTPFGPGQRMERSATISTPLIDLRLAETAVSARRRSSRSTSIERRVPGSTTWCRVRVSPDGSR